jgi:hypothetical protein
VNPNIPKKKKDWPSMSPQKNLDVGLGDSKNNTKSPCGKIDFFDLEKYSQKVSQGCES